MMECSASIGKISQALLKAQRKMGNAVKDAKNPFYKSSYADLNSVREASHPALNEEGISVLQPMVQKDGRSYVRTLLLHESGEWLASDTEVVAAKANDPQAQGSAISYARRYGLQSFLSLGAEDDDGEKAMARSAPAKSAPVQQATPAATQQAAPAATPASEEKPKATFKDRLAAKKANGNATPAPAANEESGLG
jgi:hypothetical protein